MHDLQFPRNCHIICLNTPVVVMCIGLLFFKTNLLFFYFKA